MDYKYLKNYYGEEISEALIVSYGNCIEGAAKEVKDLLNEVVEGWIEGGRKEKIGFLVTGEQVNRLRDLMHVYRPSIWAEGVRVTGEKASINLCLIKDFCMVELPDYHKVGTWHVSMDVSLEGMAIAEEASFRSEVGEYIKRLDF